MPNPLSPGIKLSQPELNSRNGITSRTIPGSMRSGYRGNSLPRRNPAAKQGNVSSGSIFSVRGPNESAGGTSDAYRVAPKAGNVGPRYARGDQRSTSGSQGFGAVKRPAPPNGRSPKGAFPAKMHGNFGRV